MSQVQPWVLAITQSEALLAVLGRTLAGRCQLAAVRTASSAPAAALSLLPELILIDTTSPEASGIECCRQLYAEPLLRDIPVIFLILEADPATERQAFAAGACDCVTMPHVFSRLADRIQMQLERKACRDSAERLAAERTAELAKTREALIEGLAALAGSRDAETGRHTGRIMPLVRCLAQSLRSQGFRLSDSAIEWITLASRLHDIGKVAMPDSILLKPGSLTAGEFERIKQHTVIGSLVIRRMEQRIGMNTLLTLAGEIALCHHEHWDGSGYPQGLRGDRIPIGARLVSIADVYDALTSDRPYKPAMPHEQAVAAILEGDGRTSPSHFAPAVLAAFAACQQEFRQNNRRIDRGSLPNDVNPLQC